MSDKPSQASDTQKTATLKSQFDDFFKSRPAKHQDIEKGRLEDLNRFQSEHFSHFYQPNVLVETKQIVNGMLSAFAKRVEPPHGPATIYFDFVDSIAPNGMTFTQEGNYFIGITTRLLLDFDSANLALAGSGAVRDLLATPDPRKAPHATWALITAFLALQLQFTVFHELGHMVHGDRDARKFRKEFVPTANEALLIHFPPQEAEQAKEYLADRHAVRMLLENYLNKTRGRAIVDSIESTLAEEECLLRLIILSIAAVFFFGPSDRFHLPIVRQRPYPCDLARLNIVMRSIVEWAESKNLPTVRAWAHDPCNFELITSRLRQAVDNPEKVDEWLAQGDYLHSEAGSHYLDVIYRDGGVITPKTEENWWRITAAI